MSNPTTPFSWQMPTATDLVTDLPADFEVFGQAVATSMADLLGGTTGQILSKTTNADMDFTWIANDQGDITGVTAGTGISGGGTSGTVTVTNSMATAYTTKGDLVPATGSSAFARLGVGANDTVLTADSTAATGMKWAASTAGGMTLLSTTALSGSSTTVSITPTGYNEIAVIVSGVTNGSNGNLFMGINTDTTAANYTQAFYSTENTSFYSGANVGIAGVNAIIPGQSGYLGSNAANLAQFTIYRPTGTTKKLITASSVFLSASSFNSASNTTCNYSTTSAISSIQLFTTVGSFTAGTVLVYGVK